MSHGPSDRDVPANLAGVARLFAYEPGEPLDVAEEAADEVTAGVAAERVRAAGASVTTLTFAAALGGRDRATLVRPRAGASGAGLILAHGGSADGRRFLVDEALALAAEGFTVLLPATRLPPHGYQARTEPAVRRSVLVHRRGLDLLTAAGGADPERLGFFGHSGGAFQGAVLSAVDQRLRAVVLAAFGSGTLLRLAGEELRQTGHPDPEPYLRWLDRFDPRRYVAVPGRRRLLLQHGRDDETVRTGEALRLRDAAAPPREWRDYPCGHGVDGHPPARRDRAAFFVETLTDPARRR
jgi:dipeptidyl aminopeptidase/acylaminoacyl peptidase